MRPAAAERRRRASPRRHVLLVCVSGHHGNTRRVAEAIADELGADVREPEEVEPGGLDDYDLVGFGSGVFNWRMHPRMLAFVNALPNGPHPPAFVFATSGFRVLLERPPSLARRLRGRGFRILGTFCAPGFDTSSPAMLVGGINRGRPNAADLRAARAFASRLLRDSALR